MIEWTDEALDAAWQAFLDDDAIKDRQARMRAILNAAVEKQFDRFMDVAMTFAYESGYRDGMEDVAVLVDEVTYDNGLFMLRHDTFVSGFSEAKTMIRAAILKWVASDTDVA